MAETSANPSENTRDFLGQNAETTREKIEKPPVMEPIGRRRRARYRVQRRDRHRATARINLDSAARARAVPAAST
jgi:hypothetical protein